MQQTWSLKLGPLPIGLTIETSEYLWSTLHNRLDCVRAAPSKGAIPIRLAATDHVEYRSDDQAVVRGDGNEVERHDFRLVRAGGAWRGRALASGIAVEAALRWITGVELLAAGGLLLHASSVVHSGRGHLFLGPSGAGKTTLAVECGADRILSDEVSIIAPEGDRWWVYASPFWGLERRGVGGPPAPLAAVWLLGGFESTLAQPTPAADAALGVFSRVVPIDAGDRTAELILGAIDRLVDAVPVSSLSWRRGDDLWALSASPAVRPTSYPSRENDP